MLRRPLPVADAGSRSMRETRSSSTALRAGDGTTLFQGGTAQVSLLRSACSGQPVPIPSNIIKIKNVYSAVSDFVHTGKYR